MRRLPLRWIWSLWRPHRGMLVPLVVLTVLNAVAVAAIPLAIKGVFDALGRGLTAASLRHAVIVLFLAGVARATLYCTLQNLRAWMNTRLEWSVRSRIFARLVPLGPSFAGRFASGDVITRLTSDVGDERLSWFLCSGIFRALEAGCDLTIVAWAMARLNGTLTLYCLVPLPFLFLLFMRVSSLLHDRFKRQQAAISGVNAQIESSLAGIRLVKAYAMERSRRDAFRDTTERRRQVELETVRTQVAMESLYGYAWQLTAATVLLLGGRMVITGAISLGDFVAFNGFAMSLTFPMFDLGNFLTRGRQSMVCIERLRELESFAPDVSDGTNGAAGTGTVELDAVTLQYAGRLHPALHDVSLCAPAGALVAITGRVGTGKSTLLRLVMRLLDPTAGRVRLGGRDARDLTLAAARSGMGYVPQDAVVFSGTILDNIRFGRGHLSDEDVAWAARAAHLEPDLAGFQDGLQTRVGPRGVQLSGGQKQRVALARALCGRPRVLLLDDCTAALDAATEAALWETLRGTLPDATILLVTHRTAALEKADFVAVLGEGGALLEAGMHADLLARGGEYARLFREWREDEAEGSAVA